MNPFQLRQMPVEKKENCVRNMNNFPMVNQVVVLLQSPSDLKQKRKRKKKRNVVVLACYVILVLHFNASFFLIRWMIVRNSVYVKCYCVQHIWCSYVTPEVFFRAHFQWLVCVCSCLRCAVSVWGKVTMFWKGVCQFLPISFFVLSFVNGGK